MAWTHHPLSKPKLRGTGLPFYDRDIFGFPKELKVGEKKQEAE